MKPDDGDDAFEEKPWDPDEAAGDAQAASTANAISLLRLPLPKFLTKRDPAYRRADANAFVQRISNRKIDDPQVFGFGATVAGTIPRQRAVQAMLLAGWLLATTAILLCANGNVLFGIGSFFLAIFLWNLPFHWMNQPVAVDVPDAPHSIFDFVCGRFVAVRKLREWSSPGTLSADVCLAQYWELRRAMSPLFLATAVVLGVRFAALQLDDAESNIAQVAGFFAALLVARGATGFAWALSGAMLSESLVRTNAKLWRDPTEKSNGVSALLFLAVPMVLCGFGAVLALTFANAPASILEGVLLRTASEATSMLTRELGAGFAWVIAVLFVLHFVSRAEKKLLAGAEVKLTKALDEANGALEEYLDTFVEVGAEAAPPSSPTPAEEEAPPAPAQDAEPPQELEPPAPPEE